MLRALACALTLAAGAGSASAAPAPPGREFFGMNAQEVFKLPQDAWDRQLAAIAATGVGVVRRDAFWSNVESTPPVRGVHRYVWTRPDAVIAALARNGLRWYPILDYSTPWAGTLDGPARWKSAPANPADFAAYAAAFAQRYGGGGSFWAAHPELPRLAIQSYELWNEPNLDEFWPDVTGAADRYGDLLAATLPALRAADPAAEVVVGGLSPTGLVPFLDRIEADRPGLVASADAVAFHPYGTTFSNTGARVRVLRDWLDAHGAAALPLEITETGWATPPLSESARATRMAALVPGLADSSCDVSRFIAQTWITPDVDLSDPNDYFGIANADATLKPTGVALTGAIAAVEDGAASPPSDPCAGRVASSPRVRPAPAPPPLLAAPVPPASPAPVIAERVAAPALVQAPAAAPAVRPPARIHARVLRRGHAVVVLVRCPRACRTVARVQGRRGARVATSLRGAYARRHRTRVPLGRHRAGRVRILVRVQLRGAAPVTLVRMLR